MLLTAPGIADHISGVILYDETLRQKTADGVPFPTLLSGMGIVPGIKVDTGAKDLAAFPGEKVTEGLDGLRERLAEYYEMGARFAKWRAVITIGDGIPSDFCLHANAHALARYAALCQEASIVPIVEPEVLMDGDHTLADCEEVTNRALTEVFAALAAHRVHLPGIVLKPNMVISGTECADRAGCWFQRARNRVAGQDARRRPEWRKDSKCGADCGQVPTQIRRKTGLRAFLAGQLVLKWS